MSSKFRVAFADVFRTLRRLFLEVIGTLFLALALFGITGAVQAYTSPKTEGSWPLISSILLAIIGLGFGIHSFWKSRKAR